MPLLRLPAALASPTRPRAASVAPHINGMAFYTYLDTPPETETRQKKTETRQEKDAYTAS